MLKKVNTGFDKNTFHCTHDDYSHYLLSFACSLQMEGVIKNGEESRIRSMSSAARLHEEYLPLKSEVDRLRRDCLGLERLPDLHEEEGSNITPE